MQLASLDGNVAGKNDNPNITRARCARVVQIVAAERGVSERDILRPTRSRAPVASARQLAMYLCHVLLGLNLSEVGKAFGRDRTTVAHACALVEDSREHAGIDQSIQRLEDAIVADSLSVQKPEMGDRNAKN